MRVYERSGEGRKVAIWIDYRDEAGHRHRHPLNLTDRDQAKLKADEIAAQFRREGERRPNELTLAGLIDIYEREVTPTKSLGVQKYDRRTFELFLRFFGRDRRPETLSRREWDAYIRARRSGKLRPPNAKERVVGDQILEHDLKLLNAVLNWATLAGDGRRTFLLERNPLKGLPIPKEESPKRALLADEQYDLVRSAAIEINPRIECFVILAWQTGHRSASIRQLRWSDVDLEAGTILWRGEVDKIGYEHRNPLHPAAVAVLKRERARTPAIGEAWIFPGTHDGHKPMSRDATQRLWQRLAKKARLPENERFGWHSLRRAFANRYRRAPLRDLQDLGGWKSSATLLKVYLRADEAAQREVLQGAGTAHVAPGTVATAEQEAPRMGTIHRGR
ncbi:MAG: site-specific integrase [Gemmatimonadota bacterium]|nr:site-specific integrase [Gemmatimonadota bacterium]